MNLEETPDQGEGKPFTKISATMLEEGSPSGIYPSSIPLFT